MTKIAAPTIFGIINRASDSAGEAPGSLSREWAVAFETVSASYCLKTAQPGAKIEFSASLRPASLCVMHTPWSGMISVRAGGDTRIYDTFSPTHELRSIDLAWTQSNDLTLLVLERRNPQSQGYEIWIREAILQTRPYWQRRHEGISDSLTLVDGDFGRFLVFEHDRPISSEIKDYGYWGIEQVQQFRKLVRPGTCAVDIGANLGHHTVVLSKLVGANGTVLAFEPQPRVHRVLQANLALNGCRNVVPYEYALGAEDGTAKMVPQDYDSGIWNVGGLGIATTSAPTAEGISVGLRRLDELARDYTVDFIKSDAQGFDYLAFQGATETIKKSRPLIVSEVAPAAIAATGHSYTEFYSFLTELGYRIYRADNISAGQHFPQWSGVNSEEWDIVALHESRTDHAELVRSLT